ncbi:hypothetical protein SNQ31_000573 [Cronobacter sakazakii]|nr:hypothetical protein [Cronobacter sakazakii]
MSTISNERLGAFILGSQPWNEEIEQMATELLALHKERERAEPVSLVVKHINDPYADPDFDEPPEPVAADDSEIKWRELALQFDGHRMQAICFLKQILNELPEAEFSSAREFLKAGPLSGEEVLRNRIADLAPPAPVVVDDSLPFDPQIAEYEQMMEAEQAQADTTSQQFESLAGKTVGNDGFECTPVADLYELLTKCGECYDYTTSAKVAAAWIKDGYSAREYVKLDRLQEALLFAAHEPCK